MRWGIWAVAAVALAGCASTEELAVKDDAQCRAIGVEPGSPAYGQCRTLAVQSRIAERQAFAARMYAAGAALRDTPEAPAPASTIPAGFTKVCAYNTIMGQRAVTVGAAELCPLLPPS